MIVTQTSHRVRLVVVAGLAVVIAAVATWAALGGPVIVLLLIAPVPWMLAIGVKRGVALAIAAPLLLSWWLLAAVLAGTAATGLPMLATVIGLTTISGLGGVAMCSRRVDSVKLPSSASLAAWIPSLFGAGLWLGVIAVSTKLPGSSKLSWVMGGDAANNILFAREVVYRGGIVFGPEENPVPLTSVLMGVSIASGRGGVSPQRLLAHDLAAFAGLWVLLIALTCLLAGAVAASVVRAVTLRPLTIGIVAAGASCLPLTWFVSGYPIEFGFFNTVVALVIVLSAFLTFLSYRSSPAMVLAVQGFAATLLLAVWSPLVLLPAVLGLVLIALMWRRLLVIRGAGRAILMVAIIQLFGYGVAVVVPSVIALGEFLSAQGGAHGFRRALLPVLGVCSAVLAILTLRGHRSSALVGILAIVAGSGIGLTVLLFISRNEPTPWTYYPLKFAWLTSVVLIILIAGLLPALVLRFLKTHALQHVGSATIVTMIVLGVVIMPSVAFNVEARGPMAKILDGDFIGEGDAVAERVIALVDPEQSHILWNSGEEHETSINFWLMGMWADSMNENFDLRAAAYGLDGTTDIAVLCRNIKLMGGGTVVHTRVPELQQDLDEACPEVHAELAGSRAQSS